MKFHEKLNFIMQLTNVKNNELGKALNFDPSYISRIRSGKRGLPKEQPFTVPASVYFSRKLKEPHNQRVAAEIICHSHFWPGDPTDAAILIAAWLTEASDSADLFQPVPGNETADAYPAAGRFSLNTEADRDDISGQGRSLSCFYYGNDGKRRGILHFLTKLCNTKRAYRLYLYSDEDMSWLYEEPSFAQDWSRLLLSLIQNGSSIVIIHTISRNIGEMLEALQKWTPIYSTGAVTPYYCARIRDGILRRSLFIAADEMAFTSNSIGQNTEGMLNQLIAEPAAVRALMNEYNQLYRYCKPLMLIIDNKSLSLFFTILNKLVSDGRELMVARHSPSLFTMPGPLFQGILKRIPDEHIRSVLERNVAILREALENGAAVTEYLYLPSVVPSLPPRIFSFPEKPESSVPDIADNDSFSADLNAARASVPVKTQQPADPDIWDIRYTPEEYTAHLNHILRLIKEKPNYRVIPVTSVISSMNILSKEDSGALFYNYRPRFFGYSITEPRMISALLAYLEQSASGIGGNDPVNKTADTGAEVLLRKYIDDYCGLAAPFSSLTKA